MSKLTFPTDFIWGVATSAYQIEGSYQSDGKGESIWDHFSHIPGNIANNENGDVACDHYRLYPEDVKLMKMLGVKSYRFSIAWPRIFPDGFGEPNKKGMDFYKRLVRLLTENGIIPLVTLYHWDLPQKLQEKGGWANRETAEHFVQYAQYVFKELGDSVPLWTTFNEPWVTAFVGHWFGGHPPGVTDLPTALRAAHHILLAHGKTVRIFREMGMKGEIGITLSLSPVYPASEDPLDAEAALRYGDFINGWFLDPILKGNYPPRLWQWFANEADLPIIDDGDLAIIHEPIDFLGINNYSSSSVGKGYSHPLRLAFADTGKAKTDTGWEIYPKGLYDLLKYLHEEYKGIKMFITENGAAFKDKVNDDGNVEDDERINYLREHIIQAHRAINDGVRLAGYYVWSLMDNFEWRLGYAKRFGLVYIDYETQKRIVKKSGWWFKQVIEDNGLEQPESLIEK